MQHVTWINLFFLCDDISLCINASFSMFSPFFSYLSFPFLPHSLFSPPLLFFSTMYRNLYPSGLTFQMKLIAKRHALCRQSVSNSPAPSPPQESSRLPWSEVFDSLTLLPSVLSKTVKDHAAHRQAPEYKRRLSQRVFQITSMTHDL